MESREPMKAEMDAVKWEEIKRINSLSDGLYATHEGVLHIMGVSLKVYTLNNGQRVFDADDFHAKLMGQ